MKTKADILIVGNLLCINEIRGGNFTIVLFGY